MAIHVTLRRKGVIYLEGTKKEQVSELIHSAEEFNTLYPYQEWSKLLAILKEITWGIDALQEIGADHSVVSERFLINLVKKIGHVHTWFEHPSPNKKCGYYETGNLIELLTKEKKRIKKYVKKPTECQEYLLISKLVELSKLFKQEVGEYYNLTFQSMVKARFGRDKIEQSDE